MFQRTVAGVLFFCALCFTTFGQSASYSVTGTVVDSVNNEPLGFVTVVFNNQGTLGTTTNAFGKFEFMHNAPVQSLTCSFIGYNAKTIRLNSNLKSQDVTVKLVPSQYNLQNVVIASGENPANRIVRRVVSNRDANDPDKLDSYSYTAYNKFIYSGVPPALSKKTNDTARLYKFLEDHHLFILESVVETKFRKGEQRKEVVVGNKISGMQDPSFSLMNTQIQQFSMYTAFIELMSKQYENPFSRGSTDRYFFNVEDTIFEGADTIYRLSYKPWKGRNFDGLRGMAEIHTDGYAIKSITAEPADTISAP
ncbi:MAG TPA: carboxypeptidase-like regulatory domain-containing protein, partial [Chitinophagales bacterium]|nr:carboxypeptidase-like regulatory domain-containing protein [Chitinophagales bacterium]